MTLIRLIKKAFRKFGIEIMRSDSVPESVWSHLLELLRTTEVSVLFDVGANEGQFAATLREIGYGGRIISFEPASQPFAILSKKAHDDPLWEVHQLGLSDLEGSAEINVFAESVFASLLEPTAFGSARFTGLEKAGRESIRLTTLNRFIESRTDLRNVPYFLKMDTQGLDVQVFRGAGERLEDCRALLSELSVLPIYHGMPTYEEALKVYRNAGFSVTGLFALARQTDLAVIEMDCTMVRATGHAASH
ncbi:MAG: FkbM family methyltransferase [Pseudomonadota bacterium]